MNILQLATSDHGGATYFLRDALISHTEHECRAVRYHQNRCRYPYDILAPSDQELAELYDWADVVHLHDEAGAVLHDNDLDGKPVVITWHGTKYRENHEVFDQRCVKRGWLVTASTLDLTQWGAQWLPTPRRDVMHDWRPPETPFVVVHAPTDKERKRTVLIESALDDMESVRLNVVHGRTYRKCLQKKAVAHLLVDGWLGYGNNAIEAWALGLPVVSNAPMWLADLMLETWGYVPFHRITAAEVLSELEAWPVTWAVGYMATCGAAYAYYQQLGRRHFLTYHEPSKVAERLVGFYEEAMA